MSGIAGEVLSLNRRRAAGRMVGQKPNQHKTFIRGLDVATARASKAHGVALYWASLPGLRPDAQQTKRPSEIIGVVCVVPWEGSWPAHVVITRWPGPLPGHDIHLT